MPLNSSVVWELTTEGERPFHCGIVRLQKFKDSLKACFEKYCCSKRLEDLKVLRRSPDLLNNVKIGQGQLQLIMEQILFYHIWELQIFWSSDLNNLMNNPSKSPVISEKQIFR